MDAFSVADFRKSLPEFSSADKYPDSLIQGWACVAEKQVNSRYWKNQTCLGVRLYVAHEITLEAMSIAAAKIGGVPGQQSGQANTKTVGSATIGYDTTSAAEKDAGWWNLTTYGKQFIRLARMFGAGAIQL